MRDQSLQPSPIVFPSAILPAEDDTAEEGGSLPHGAWGWLELFVLVQVLWGVLLFVPGSQAYRVYIRGFPYVASLVALGACMRSGGADSGAPGARWILAALALMIASLVHPATWLMSGVAQIVFQLSIAAPVFWTARNWLTNERLERVILLVLGANFLSAAIGLLQVYYPDTFMPPEFSRLAIRLNADMVGALTYTGADGREIVRPPGLSDMPGGAAVSATVTALLAFAFATRAKTTAQLRLWFLAASVIGLTVVYLTQVRSMLVMICLCMLAAGAVRLRQGRVAHSVWVLGSALALVIASFTWAVAVGGDSVLERFQSILDVGVVQSYQENRGMFLSYTLRELLYEYPFGAGIGRWGMMSAYFGEPTNWQFPALWAEIQLTGWWTDGGVLLWICYTGAIATAALYTYRVASSAETHLSDLATMVLSVQVLVIGLCFTGPVFNTQTGIVFWLLSASVYGAERTALYSEYYALEVESANEESAGAQAERSSLRPTTPWPRVLHVVPALFGPSGIVGGAERYVFELARHMADRVPTRLLSFGSQETATREGNLDVRVMNGAWHVRGQRTNPFTVAIVPEILKADVVHCHQHHILLSSAAAAVCRVAGRRVFATDLGGGGWDVSAYVSTDRWFHAHLHISEYSRHISNHDGQRWARVILGGVDTSKFSPDPSVPRSNRALFVGRLLPHKGIADLIEALPGTVALDIVGPVNTTGAVESLKAQAAGKAIVFHHGLGDAALVERYRQALCLVLPSVYRTPDGQHTDVPELLGQTLLEAMACSTPVVCTRVASMPEIVEDGVSGFIVEPGDHATLRSRLEWLAAHPAEASVMGAAGRERVLARFQWPDVVERCLDVVPERMIHFLTPEYPPRNGGVADYTHQIATELSRGGETVHVWGPSGSARQPGSAIVVHPELGRFRPADLRRADVLLNEFPSPRRLVVQWVPHGFGQRAMNLPFCFWLWQKSVAGDAIELIVHEPFMTFSGGIRQCAVAAVQRAMTLMLLSAARRVWVMTRSWAPLLEPYLSGRCSAIEWLPVPSSLQCADAGAVGEVRRRYASAGQCLIGHFGTHGPLVTSLLADAIPSIAAARLSARFVLIGSGGEAFLSALVSSHTSLAGRVGATGTLNTGELAAHVAACDVLLQPYPDGVTSRRTTAMAGLFARVPVVTTRGQLTEQFWQDGSAMRLADVGDVDAMVDHVLQLLADPAERQRQADAGRAFYDRWFDVRHTIAALAA